MSDPVKGGRERIGGITLSAPEKRLVDKARKAGPRKFSRAEYIRDAAVGRARQDLGLDEPAQAAAVNQ